MAQQYRKNCRDCGAQILMVNNNGKWTALEADNSTAHSCGKKSQQPQQHTESVQLSENVSVAKQASQSEVKELAEAIRDLAEAIKNWKPFN